MKLALSSTDCDLSESFSDTVGEAAFGLANGLAPAKAPKPNVEPLTMGFEDTDTRGDTDPFSSW